MSAARFCEAKLLLPDDHQGLLQFERDFYKAYQTIPKQKLIRQIWNWNDEQKRISLKCPYDDCALFVWQENGVPTFYVGGTFDQTVFSQFKYYGFETPDGINQYCEVFTLFATPLLRTSIFEIDALFLQTSCFHYSKSKGVYHVLATCTGRMLSLYTRWGWEILSSRVIEGEERYFILKELN
ncbi:MAG: hypothetical protein LPK45_03030 [Bacteroidota bacterium]|nr:hypothetical protein [Bacteroidota bacterium]MDX5430014.1 hypothetical protein [Bacteroidota bacterium]MDX5468787.1 hypothetical protein [Bacteroidota bacterium]